MLDVKLRFGSWAWRAGDGSECSIELWQGSRLVAVIGPVLLRQILGHYFATAVLARELSAEPALPRFPPQPVPAREPDAPSPRTRWEQARRRAKRRRP